MLPIFATLSCVGLFLTMKTVNTFRKGINNDLLRARIFLNKSFIKDNLTLLLLACVFFILHAGVEFFEPIGLDIEKNVEEILIKIFEMAVMVCIFSSGFKWYTLINSSRQIKESTK